jgi:uncharacterized membrane protein YbjE (DUF340 family)
MALRLWWHRQQAPTPASASTIVDVVRPLLTPTAAAIVAWCALCLACVAAVAVGYGAGWFALSGLGITAGLVCLVARLREAFGRG